MKKTNSLLAIWTATVLLSLRVFAASPNPVVPFLAVTGRPTEAELACKVAALKADGFDSFLIYARSGLQYEYMGEDWLRCVDVLCAEADRHGMTVWLYDDYNWPSGTCKGRVPNENEDFRYSEWAVYRNADGAFRWQKVLAPRGWVNVLDDGAMKRFLEVTHEVYERRLAKWFAKKLIRGIFTDEPGHPTAIRFEGDPLCHFARWNGLEDEYRRATGGDFRRAVEDALSGKGSSEVWETYAALKGRRFRTNYFDRIDAWCRKVGIVSTGHMIGENSVEGSCRYNGDPLVALKGESLPGMDEIGTRAGANAEWLTLAVAQHAIARRGNGGMAELFALGPNDLSPARLRQMIWLTALFGVDHYLTAMQSLDQKGLVEKHGYLAPIQSGQPWHGEMPLLLDEARAAADVARRKGLVWHAAVRYPQRAAARFLHAGGPFPDVRALLESMERLQLTPNLVEETEETDLPFVFELLGDGASREVRTGTDFRTADEAAAWLWTHASKRTRYFELDGTPARDLVVREFADGSSVALDILNVADRRVIVERAGVRKEGIVPARGVCRLEKNEFPTEATGLAARAWTPEATAFDYELDRDNVIRLMFDKDRVARFTLTEPLEARLVLRDFALSYAVTETGRPVDFEAPSPGEKVFRHVAEPYAFELDGQSVAGVRTAEVLPVEYNPLYRETAKVSLAAGAHELRLVSGEADRNFFLPAAFISGRIARKGAALGALPDTLGFGSLSDFGLGDYCGAVTYRIGRVTPTTSSIRVSTGGLFTRVKWNGRDLGARGWAPFDWKLPSADPGTLEVTVYTPVVNLMGDVNRPGSDWDVLFWTSPRDADYAAGLFRNEEASGAAAEADLFIGTAGEGNVSPAATVPFGLVQPGPDTTAKSSGYVGNKGHIAGYQWTDGWLARFSQTRLSGTGCGSGGDIGILPTLNDRYAPVKMVKSSEKATPGFYGVSLENGIACELTASPHVSAYRFAYPAADASLVLDLDCSTAGFSPDTGSFFGVFSSETRSSELKQVSPTRFVGHRRSQHWVEYDVYFVLETSAPVQDVVTLSEPRAPRGGIWRLAFGRLPANRLEVRVGLSLTSAEAAVRNLEAEMPRFDFDGTRLAARRAWSGLLGRFQLGEGTPAATRKLFYTGLYRAAVQPNDVGDVGAPFYSTFSLWDTFRAAHPLYTLWTPERVDGFVDSLLKTGERLGHLPIWGLWKTDTYCMVGHHAVPVIVDAYLKGFRGFDADKAYAAVVDAQTAVHKSVNTATWGMVKEDWPLIDRCGYLPFDALTGSCRGRKAVGESVSRLLECAYDDACAARFAAARGDGARAEFFAKRADNWRNVLDPETGWVRGRDSSGAWRTPFDPYHCGHCWFQDNDFTEGNAMQYTWHVMQDPDGLVAALGGREKALAKLRSLFEGKSSAYGENGAKDVTGLIGQYAHGNEPSHHLIYFFTLLGRPDLTAKYVRQVFDTLYRTRPDGLCGNDDCGQMSAWYVFSALGFYPFDPCSGEYVLGAPQVSKVSLRIPSTNYHLPTTNSFTVVARNFSAENKYVKAVSLNGRPVTSGKIRHADILKGGELVFEMCKDPDGGTSRPTPAELVRRASSGPCLLLSPERLQAVREKARSDPDARDWWRRFKATCDRQLDEPYDIPDRGGQWQAWYNCRACGNELRTESPTRHVCKGCGRCYTGFPYDDVPLTHRHLEATRRIRSFALAYLVSDDRRYADKAKEGLLAYAKIYPGLPLHNKGGRIDDPKNSNREKPAKALCEVLWECEWFIPALQGFDAISQTLTEAEREEIRSNLVRPFVPVSKLENARIHNHQCWHLSGFGQCALVLGDERLLDEALNGQWGLRAQLREGILPDGSWFEGAWRYHFYVFKALNSFVMALDNLGYAPDPRYKAMYLAPFKQVSSSWQLPALHDSARMAFGPGSYPEYYEPAFAWWDDPLLGAWLSGRRRNTEQYALYGRPPARTEKFSWSVPRPLESGFGVLRSRTADDRGDGMPGNYLGIDYGAHGGWHGHYDKMSVVLYGHHRLLAEDPGTIGYGNPRQFGWYRTSLAHNTLLVDNMHQAPARGRLLAFTNLTNGAAIAVDAGPIARGVTARRAVALSGDLVFDMVWAESEEEHDWEWCFHSRGEFETADKGRALSFPTPVQPYREGRPYDTEGSNAWWWVSAPTERAHDGTWSATWRHEGVELNVFQRCAPGAFRTGKGGGTPLPLEFALVTSRTRGKSAAFATVMTLNGSRDVRIEPTAVGPDGERGFAATVDGTPYRLVCRPNRGDILFGFGN